MGGAQLSLPDAQTVGTNALQNTVTLLGNALNTGFPTQAQFNQQQANVAAATSQALSSINNSLITGEDYSQNYTNQALNSMNAEYGIAQDTMAPAVQAQKTATNAYTDMVGLTTPTNTPTPSTYQAGTK